MFNWKKIQELDLKEVAAKTQIELDFLEALVEKNFLVLNRFNVRGFIKILSREYELDFSDFNEEYEAYLKENNPTPQSKSKTISPKLDIYGQKASSTSLFLPIIIILIIIASIMYYFDTFKFFFKEEHNNTSPTVIDIIGQAQENLKSLENNIIIIDDNKDQEFDQQELGQSDKNISSFNQVYPYLNEQNASVNNDLENDSSKQVQFKISSEIWVGLIDLKTFKKTSFIKEKDFNISLAKDQLVLTGAAALSIFDQENKEQEFPAGKLKRFLIKDGQITSILAAEFVELNKGKEW